MKHPLGIAGPGRETMYYGGLWRTVLAVKQRRHLLEQQIIVLDVLVLNILSNFS